MLAKQIEELNKSITNAELKCTKLRLKENKIQQEISKMSNKLSTLNKRYNHPYRAEIMNVLNVGNVNNIPEPLIDIIMDYVYEQWCCECSDYYCGQRCITHGYLGSRAFFISKGHICFVNGEYYCASEENDDAVIRYIQKHLQYTSEPNKITVYNPGAGINSYKIFGEFEICQSLDQALALMSNSLSHARKLELTAHFKKRPRDEFDDNSNTANVNSNNISNSNNNDNSNDNNNANNDVNARRIRRRIS